nr:MAG TPA_asm: hypothetical protein [Caudoviricetes sp.]
MTVHDRTRLNGQLRLLTKNPAPAGFLLSGDVRSVMNDCPRRFS